MANGRALELYGQEREPGAGPGRARGPGHALHGVPDPVVALVPECELLGLADEPLADCSDCGMLPHHFGGGDGHASVHEWAFNPDVRCCTYHPRLPNYAVGQALARGGTAARVIVERLGDPSGVSVLGIGPSAAHQEARLGSPLGFGRDRSLRCPFWVGGAHTCGIWQHRNSVCRTWFCKHSRGVHASVRWTAMQRALSHAEKLLAHHLVREGRPPDGNDGHGHGPVRVDVDAWCAWFRWCASALDRVDTRALLATCADDERLRRLRLRLDDLAAASVPAPLEVVVPVLRGSLLLGKSLWLYGYSSYDCAGFDASIIEFLARLDGSTPWPVALEQVRHLWPGTAHDVHELLRIGVLQPPGQVIERALGLGMELPPADPDAPMPERLIAALGKPIAVRDKVWLQGAVPLGSVIAPRNIFSFLAHLDGQTSWRDALARVPSSERQGVDESLIRSIHRIGGLQAAYPVSP